MSRSDSVKLQKRYWQTALKAVKFCFRCGGILRWETVREEHCRRHRCSRCGGITYLNPRVVVGVIPVTKEGRVVLIRRATPPARGQWSYPAGYMEMGESVEKAAAREAREEIGVSVRVGRLVGIYSYPFSGVVTLVYEGSVATKFPSQTEEALEVKAFSLERIPWKKMAFVSTLDALKDWITGRKVKRTRSSRDNIVPRTSASHLEACHSEPQVRPGESVLWRTKNLSS